MQPRAIDIERRKITNEEILTMSDLVRSTPNSFGIELLSSKSMDQMHKLKDCLQILKSEDTGFDYAKKLAKIVGPYFVDPRLSKYLRRFGVRLPQRDRIPYTAPVDFLDRELYEQKTLTAWKVSGVREFVEANNLDLVAWDFESNVTSGVDQVLHAGGDSLSCWNALSAIEILNSHKKFSYRIFLQYA